MVSDRKGVALGLPEAGEPHGAVVRRPPVRGAPRRGPRPPRLEHDPPPIGTVGGLGLPSRGDRSGGALFPARGRWSGRGVPVGPSPTRVAL